MTDWYLQWFCFFVWTT